MNIKILHHDDWFANEESLKKLVEVLYNNPNVDFAYCQSVDIDKNNNHRYHDFGNETNLIKNDIYILIANNFIGAPSTTIYRKNSLLFDENLKWLVDIDFYIRILQNNPNFIYIPEICINIGISDTQVTNSCLGNQKIEMFENLYVYKKYKKYFKYNKLKKFKYLLTKTSLKYLFVHLILNSRRADKA